MRALSLDPKNRRALLLLERVYRDLERWENLAEALEAFADEVSAKNEKLATLGRLAPQAEGRLDQPRDRSTSASSTFHQGTPRPRARWSTSSRSKRRGTTSSRSTTGSSRAVGVRPGQEGGIIVQIAMTHGARAAARRRRAVLRASAQIEPAHAGMLTFFREWCREKAEPRVLVAILSDAQRAMPERVGAAQLRGRNCPARRRGGNARRRSSSGARSSRAEPNNVNAREALKRLLPADRRAQPLGRPSPFGAGTHHGRRRRARVCRILREIADDLP